MNIEKLKTLCVPVSERLPSEGGQYLTLVLEMEEPYPKVHNYNEHLGGWSSKKVISWLDLDLLTTKKAAIELAEREKMRKSAISIFELTKGFTGEPTDNAMKAALEMAGYVMILTNE
jgi:hypothetical protein